jgi:hypothetical protein
MIDQKKIEFIVEFVEDRPASLLIAGRCAKGKVKVGDCFDAVYKYSPVGKLDDYAHSAERTDERPVSLLVKAIFSYGMSLDEIDSGLTAELTLTGKNENLVNVGDVLGGKE